jgi:hypothetical protein
MASTNAGKFKNLDVEMQKTPVNRGVLSLLKSSKQVQNGLPVIFPIVTGSIGNRLWVPQTMSKGSSPWRPFPRPYHNQDNSVGQYNMYIRRANVQLAVFMGLLLQIIIGRNRFRRPFPAVPEPLHREFDAAIDSFPLVKPLSTSEIS